MTPEAGGQGLPFRLAGRALGAAGHPGGRHCRPLLGPHLRPPAGPVAARRAPHHLVRAAVFRAQPESRVLRLPGAALYLLGALYGVYYLWGLLAGQFTDAAAFAASLREHWEPFFVIRRTTAATMGSATVLVVYALGARLFGVQTGLLAALFAALSFLHARDSHFGTTDVPMTFFLM